MRPIALPVASSRPQQQPSQQGDSWRDQPEDWLSAKGGSAPSASANAWQAAPQYPPSGSLSAPASTYPASAPSVSQDR